MKIVLERFFKTLKSKIYKYMTSMSKNVYIDKLDDIVNISNNIYHGTINMKSVDVKSRTYLASNKKNNKEDPKFEVGDHVRISKYKKTFQIGWKKSL